MGNLIPLLSIVIGIVVFIHRFIHNVVPKMKIKDQTINNIFYLLSNIKVVRDVFTKMNSLNVYKQNELKLSIALDTVEILLFDIILWFGILIYTQELFITFISMPLILMYTFDTLASKADKEYLKFLSELEKYCMLLTSTYTSNSNIIKTFEDCNQNGYLKNYSRSMCNLCYNDFSSRKEEIKLRNNGFQLNSAFGQIISVCANLGSRPGELSESPFSVCIADFTELVRSNLHLGEFRKSNIGNLKPMFLISAIFFVVTKTLVDTRFTMIKHIYYGVPGVIGKFGFVVLWCSLFYAITRFSTLMVYQDYDRSEFSDFLAKIFKPIIAIVKPRNEKKIDDLDLSLKLCGSFHSVDTFYAMKIFYCIIGYIAILTLTISSLLFTRVNIRHDFSNYNTSGNFGYNEETHDYFQELDDKYLNMTEQQLYDMTNSGSDEEVKQIINEDYYNTIPGVLEIQANKNYTRIMGKREAYAQTYLPWYFPLVVLLISIVLYFVPNILLRVRKLDYEKIRALDVDTIRHLLILYSFTTFIEDEILTRLGRIVVVLRKELIFTREIASTVPENIKRRTLYIGDDLAQIYNKLYLIATRSTAYEALYDVKGMIKSIMTTRETLERASVEQTRAIFSAALIAPILYIVIILLSTPLLSTATQMFKQAVAGLN